MQSVIEKPIRSRHRSHPTAWADTAEVVRSDASPGPNPAGRAPGWPLVAEPLNWPWAKHYWNCSAELRRP
jgi:hypothetical protein